MNAASLFARLTTRSTDYDLMPFGDSADAVNIALYTQGMQRRAYIAARFILSRDLTVQNELTGYVRMMTLKVAMREKWRITGQMDKINVLVDLAMLEHYAPYLFRSQKSRYAFCDISETRWHSLWLKRYDVPYAAIAGYLDVARGSVHK